MDEIFPSIHRFTVGKTGRSHTYLLVREQGNLLICHANRGSSVVDFLDEVEVLGGIVYQFVPEYADAAKGKMHGLLYQHFGCELRCPSRDQAKVAKKRECPISAFGDEGVKLGHDFQAIDIGHTVFHWTNAGKHFLIPGHAIHQDDGDWDVHMHAFSDPQLPMRRLSELPVDYLLPGRAKARDEDFFTFTQGSRKAYQQALRESLTPVLYLGLIQSCKACDVNPWAYFDDILRRIMAHPVRQLRQLLPDQWRPLERDARGLILHR